MEQVDEGIDLVLVVFLLELKQQRSELLDCDVAVVKFLGGICGLVHFRYV